MKLVHILNLFFLYSWSIFLSMFWFFVQLIALFSKTAKWELNKRHFTKEDLKKIKEYSKGKKRKVCFFFSSAGEYEQGLPLILELKKRQDVFIYILFFSASGYNYAKKRLESDLFHLCPLDILWVWERFYKVLGACDSIVVRYELWPSFLHSASKYGKLILVNAVCQKSNSSFFSLIFKRYLYSYFDKIFLVDDLFKQKFINDYKIEPDSIIISGDTKYERVLHRKKQQLGRVVELSNKFSDSYCEKKIKIIAGSVWEADIKLLFKALNILKFIYQLDIQLICVPHELSKKVLKKVEKECNRNNLSFFYFSHTKQYISENRNKIDADIIVVDELGYLAEFYSLGHMAYVGGGIHHRVHNVLEPIAYGLAVSFGPLHQTSFEAKKLVDKDLAEVVHTVSEIVNWCSFHYDVKFMQRSALLKYVEKEQGATSKILKNLEISSNREL